MNEWEDAPGWLHEAIKAQEGGFTAAEWQEWERIRLRLQELDLVFEPAAADHPVRDLAAYRSGQWVAGVPVRWNEHKRPVMPALRELLMRAGT